MTQNPTLSVTFEKRGAVALVTLNRPQALNSFTRQMHHDLWAAFDQAEADAEIRAMVLAPRDEPVAPLAELLMVFAARAQHIEQFIVPHLDAGTWVVSDRFTDATYAYQGCGRGIDTAAILELERLVQGAMQPDLTLYLDCPPEIGMARADARAALDRIETAGMDFMNRVRAGYLARISQYPQRFVTIDASVALPQVKAQLIAALDARIGSLL